MCIIIIYIDVIMWHIFRSQNKYVIRGAKQLIFSNNSAFDHFTSPESAINDSPQNELWKKDTWKLESDKSSILKIIKRCAPPHISICLYVYNNNLH